MDPHRFSIPAGVTILTFLLCPGAGAQIQVHLYCDVAVPAERLQRARLEADRILRSTGVRLEWSSCDPLEQRGGENGKPSPHILRLRLYPATAAASFGVADDTFGFALSEPAPGFGVFAGIFHQRVEEAARRGGVAAETLLAHVIAHEIGHLLLGGGGHAADGIMRFPWGGRELRRMARGALRFHPRQAKVIDENVRARLRAAGLPESERKE